MFLSFYILLTAVFLTALFLTAVYQFDNADRFQPALVLTYT